MRFDPETVNNRKPLWMVLSNLFLDTELQDVDLRFIAKTMKDSEYSLDEIEHILMYEVFPVCLVNLHSVAGVWTGFDEEWLINRINSTNHPSIIKQWINRRSFWMIKEDWNCVVKRYNTLSN